MKENINEVLRVCFNNGITIYPIHLPAIIRKKLKGKVNNVYKHRDNFTIEINKKGKLSRDKATYTEKEVKEKIKEYYKFFVK